MFCNGISHLCNFNSELTLTQTGFPIGNQSKKRVLQWIIACVQMKVRVDNDAKLILHCKTQKQEVFCNGIAHLRNFKSELTLIQIGFSRRKH